MDGSVDPPAIDLTRDTYSPEILWNARNDLNLEDTEGPYSSETAVMASTASSSQYVSTVSHYGTLAHAEIPPDDDNMSVDEDEGIFHPERQPISSDSNVVELCNVVNTETFNEEAVVEDLDPDVKHVLCTCLKLLQCLKEDPHIEHRLLVMEHFLMDPNYPTQQFLRNDSTEFDPATSLTLNRSREAIDTILSEIDEFISGNRTPFDFCKDRLKNLQTLVRQGSGALERLPIENIKLEAPTPIPQDDEDNDGQTCPICLDSWSISGEHRLTALKCGHLFGHSCIRRWLRQTLKTERNCPTCKTKATARDLRFIFARKISVQDNSETEAVRSRLELVTTEKNQIELALQKAELNKQLVMQRVTELEETLRRSASSSDSTVGHCRVNLSAPKLAIVANVEVTKDESCRILTYNTRNDELYVSQQSSNRVFPGFGVRKINLQEQKLGRLLYLHPKLIRDISYSVENDTLLSVSLDKSVKIVSGRTDTVEISLQCEVPLWACCWDLDRPQRLYVGGAGGLVFQYDMRQPRSCLTRVAPAIDVSPVVSLTSVPGGFLSCQLRSLRGHRRTDSDFRSDTLMEGSFLCVKYEQVSNNVLVSCRPSVNHPRCRHMVCRSDVDDLFDSVNAHTFDGAGVQTLMSRSTLFPIEDDTFIAAHSEIDSAVTVWSLNNKRVVQTLGMQDNVVDMCPVTLRGDRYLSALSKNRLRIYKTNHRNYFL